MQAEAGAELQRRCLHALQFLKPTGPRSFYGPRRIAFWTEVNDDDRHGKAGTVEARGPREGASAVALEGFLKKHSADRGELVIEDGYYIWRRKLAPTSAFDTICASLAPVLKDFAWPKSMRWGDSDGFTWVRPLKRIVCLLAGEVVPVKLGPVTAGDVTEGHGVLMPGPFAVSSFTDWEAKLRARYVLADQAARCAAIVEGLANEAKNFGLTIAEDAGLSEEVTGLVEWPVPLIGKIELKFMSLPPEVRELSMKANQKYFALRYAEGDSAPFFGFVANQEAPDGGAAIIAGNERVLRARLADARHFWDLDLKTPLNELLPKLDGITFHGRIGTQRQRAERIAKLAREIAEALDADGEVARQAEWAGLLCKADLVTGMVGEFPELQGIMGGYYAERSWRGWDGSIVGPAVRTHYQPKGANDAVPGGVVAVSVALADKIDTLVAFFRIGETPTGSGDPYALRRAALGVIRIILENELPLPLKPLLAGDEKLFGFIIERLRVKLRGEGRRSDVLDAVLVAGADDDLVRIMQRVEAVTDFLSTADGANLLIAYRRAANILRIEDAKDGPHFGAINTAYLQAGEESSLANAFALVKLTSGGTSSHEYENDLAKLSLLRLPVDRFFDGVTVNAPEPELRLNRLRLLAQLRDTMHQIADFSKIEG